MCSRRRQRQQRRAQAVDAKRRGKRNKRVDVPRRDGDCPEVCPRGDRGDFGPVCGHPPLGGDVKGETFGKRGGHRLVRLRAFVQRDDRMTRLGIKLL